MTVPASVRHRMDPLPFVRIVTINFDGGQMTLDCVDSLLQTDYPTDRFEIVMVDNGSLDEVVEQVRTRYPSVRVIESLENTGFAGGCNLGIRLDGSWDHIALVNNDATVDPGWLRPLVDVLQHDPLIGAACPKIVFADRFQEAVVEVADAARIGNDPRPLGIRVSGARIDGERRDDHLQFDEGFHLPEAPHAPDGEEIAIWSNREGRVRVRVGDTPARRLDLRVSSLEPRTLHLSSGSASVSVDGVLEHAWIGLDLDPTVHDVINNVGSNLYRNGFGGDRGFLEIDEGQYDDPADVFAWCGGAVLLRGRYLDDVGLFDERLFLYYEDTDLSWRGQLSGWRYRTVPSAVVRHRHAQSSGVWSPVFRFYTERNRVAVLLKHAPAGLAIRACTGLLHRLIVRIGRDLVLRPLTLRLPVRTEVAHQWKVVRSLARLAPGMLRDRWRLRPVVSRRSLLAWEVGK